MESENDFNTELPSKTSRKKEMHALQALGSRLTGLSESQLDRLPLLEPLRNAIREFNRLPNSHGARRRQLQYIGRLMREYQLEEIERAIDNLLHPSGDTIRRRQQLLESCCEDVLQNGNDAINRLLEQYGHLERQTLRHILLDYQKAERDQGDAGVQQVREKLFRYLKDNLP